MQTKTSIIETMKDDMQGLWLASLGIALLTTATASMRFTAMLGIYPLEVSLFARHVVSTLVLIVVAIWLARAGTMSNKTWALGGAICMAVLSACLTLSNADSLIAGGLGIPAYVSSVVEEALAALSLGVWIGVLLPHGARKTLMVFGIATSMQGFAQITTCWLQYLPHLVLISMLPLFSAILLIICARGDVAPSTGCSQGFVNVCAHAAGKKGLPRFLAMPTLLFLLMFVVGHIIYMSLDTQQALAGSGFAEISMGVGNIVGGLFVVFVALRLAESPSISVALFVMVAAIALAYYLSTFATELGVGVYLAISSAVLQTLYALVQYFAARAFPSQPQDGRLVGYLFIMVCLCLARCLSSAFMIGQTAGGDIAYNVAVAVALAGAIACCLVLMQNAGPVDVQISMTPDLFSQMSEGQAESAALASGAVDAIEDQPDLLAEASVIGPVAKTGDEGDDVDPGALLVNGVQDSEMPGYQAASVSADTSAETKDLPEEPSSSHPTPFRDAIDAAAAESRLTPQERNVLVLLAQGRNARSIADAMTLSMNTVRSHMRNVYAKLGVHSQQELIDMMNGRVDEMRKNR